MLHRNLIVFVLDIDRIMIESALRLTEIEKFVGPTWILGVLRFACKNRKSPIVDDNIDTISKATEHSIFYEFSFEVRGRGFVLAT